MNSRTLRHLAAVTPALLVFSFVAASPAAAAPVTIVSGGVGPQTIAPSNDVITLDAGTASLSTGSGGGFQKGDLLIGNSPIPDQNISFTLSDTLTINGVTKTIVINAVDEVTTGPDTLVISAGAPTQFGNVVFTLDALTVAGNGTVGQDIAFTLKDDLAAVPEPGTLALFGTALVGLGMMRRRKAS
jgi:hypothetical protein